MNIYSIIVCYNPNINILTNTCNALLANNSNIVLVDNSEVFSLNYFSNIKDICIINLNGNFGIAKAQNIGIRLAIEKGAEIIAFFDQDSEIHDDFLYNLTSQLKKDQPMVVSPVFFDKKTGFKFPSAKLNRYGLLKNTNLLTSLNVDVIISSGSAATKKTFEIVGLMNEDYFIDFVDTEWSLRCRKKGIPIKVESTAIMKHSIGEKNINLVILRLFVHSPARSYYKIRNSFLFFRNQNVPFLLGLKEIISALIHNFLIILFVNEKWSYFKIYFQAIVDGLLGKKGKKN
jgi:rhamnosyltransferase